MTGISAPADSQERNGFASQRALGIRRYVDERLSTIRVLHVVEPRGGGVPAYVSNLAREQVHARNDVAILATTQLHVAHEHGVRMFPGWVFERRNPFTWNRARRQLLRTIATHKPDVVHVHSFFAGFIARVGRRIDAPIVYQPHAWAFHHGGVSGAIARLFERRAVRRTAVIAHVSLGELVEGSAASVRGRHGVVSVGVDAQSFAPASPLEKKAARRDLGLAADRVCVCIGRISRQKGQDRLVRAWVSTSPRAQLVFVGDGPDRKQVERLVPARLKHSVVFAGDTSDIETYLCAADVVIQPSRWEGLSLAVIEALACGVPVVATDVAGMRETLNANGECAGEVVHTDDMNRLIVAAVRRLDSPGLLERESQSARRIAEAMTWQRVQRLTNGIYVGVLAVDGGGIAEDLK
jgi:glycosyltransferase involved in cell wall biosynthesis